MGFFVRKCFSTFDGVHVVMLGLYFYFMCTCVCACELVELLLNFQRIQTEHTLLQHTVLWHPVLGTRSAHPALPFPFTLPSFLWWITFLCCSILTFCRTLHFIGTTFLRGCFWEDHKFVIIQNSLLVHWRLRFYFRFLLKSSIWGETFLVIKARVDHWTTQEWLAGWGSVFFLAVSECLIPFGMRRNMFCKLF